MSDIKDASNPSDTNAPEIATANKSESGDSERLANNGSADGAENVVHSLKVDKLPESVDGVMAQAASGDSPIIVGVEHGSKQEATNLTLSSSDAHPDTMNNSTEKVNDEALQIQEEAKKGEDSDQPEKTASAIEARDTVAPHTPDLQPQMSSFPDAATDGQASASPDADPTLTVSSSESQGAIDKPPKDCDKDNAGAADPVDEVAMETSPTPTTPTSTPADEKAPLQSVYHVKWIKFKNNQHAIITQNENGPCPLLAIMNVLLLEGRVKLPAMIEMVTSGQLMEYLGDCIFEHVPTNISEDAQLNYEQNMHDAMAVFHKLQTGLDVNVSFTGVKDFEYTPECIVFDLLGLQLYHGWLVDPQNLPQVAAISNCSYNQLVERIITQKNSQDQDQVTEALVAEDFLSSTASQLTYHGLSELADTVADNQLSVFFRNNHFSTLYKHKDELFVLVTDQGFLTESNMLWETLCNVEGDGHFVDAHFHTFRKSESAPRAPASSSSSPTPVVPSDQQIDHDYMVALSLQESGAVDQDFPQPASPLSDHQLALQLQEEENQRAAAAAAAAAQRQGEGLPPTCGRTPPPGESGSSGGGGSGRGGSGGGASCGGAGGRERKKSNSDCVIL